MLCYLVVLYNLVGALPAAGKACLVVWDALVAVGGRGAEEAAGVAACSPVHTDNPSTGRGLVDVRFTNVGLSHDYQPLHNPVRRRGAFTLRHRE